MFQKTLKTFSRVSSKIDYTKDYYQILKLPPTADQSQIRIHYYQLAKKYRSYMIQLKLLFFYLNIIFSNLKISFLYHPESQKANSEKYLNVQEAFRILSDLEYKQKYDLKRVNTADTTNQTDQQEKSDNNKQVGQFDAMKQQLFEKNDDTWKLKITVKQGQIEHNYYFSETELKEKSINCSEFEKVTSDLITNLKLNQSSIEEYQNSSFSSTSILKKVAEIGFLILTIFVTKKK